MRDLRLFARSARRLASVACPLLLAALIVGPLLAGCDQSGSAGSTTGAALAASPQGRIAVADQGSDSLSVIDIATDRVIASPKTGSQPHHVVASVDGKELWTSLYKENYLQVFDAVTLQPLATVDVGAPSDDLTFSPDGSRLYVSLGTTDAVAGVDPVARKLITTVGVGHIPHGVRVRPDG